MRADDERDADARETISVSNVGAIGRGEDLVPVLVQDEGVAIVALGRARWVWDVEVGVGCGGG